MDITAPDALEAGRIADLWVRLARGQRAHGSHLVASPNRSTVLESITRHIVTDGLLVARDPDIVGFVMFGLEMGAYEQDVSRGLVQNLYVCSDRRGDGVGSALLAAAERRLVNRGADVISLEAMADNRAAIRFYRRHGYRQHRVELEKRVESDNNAGEDA
ncbi:GNAT family N-acetyltransferase [Halegenticoccus tardaugens]|uniref:GNAT family N-acetyltransferase n=1 Tax=Halegenticoccus tardaugens TaxID=2071624 RepID=UPI00100A2BB1|nr:GNAT family N-acetyltransferase [Halegenticoccus tardaugens]